MIVPTLLRRHAAGDASAQERPAQGSHAGAWEPSIHLIGVEFSRDSRSVVGFVVESLG